MQVTAKLRHLRASPRKVRLVANLIKGLSVKEAEAQLKFVAKKAAGPILKLLNSAINNAKNIDLKKDNLYVAKITVDGGPSLKRWMPRAMGRATPILKRTSHLTLLLEERVPSKAKPKTKRKTKAEEKAEIKPPVEKIEKEEKISVAVEPKDLRQRAASARPYGASSQAKKRFFSRQSFGNIKKVFRRKSI